jgi:hypothetical protein
MGKTKFAKIEKDGIEGECLPSAAKAWERDGWTVVDDGSSGETPETGTQQTQLDTDAAPTTSEDEEKE